MALQMGPSACRRSRTRVTMTRAGHCRPATAPQASAAGADHVAQFMTPAAAQSAQRKPAEILSAQHLKCINATPTSIMPLCLQLCRVRMRLEPLPDAPRCTSGSNPSRMPGRPGAPTSNQLLLCSSICLQPLYSASMTSVEVTSFSLKNCFTTACEAAQHRAREPLRTWIRAAS